MSGVTLDIVALSDAERAEVYRRVALERLDEKSGVMEAMHASSRGGGWPQTIYRLLLRYMVTKRNREAAEQLAQCVPYNVIMRECGTLRGVEALLIGASGLLALCGDGDHAKMLRQEFTHLKSKYTITPMEAKAWSVECLNPYQHPLLHLVQVAALLHSGTITISNILSCSSTDDLKSMFGVSISDYWCNLLGDATPIAPRLGAMRRALLGINFVAPTIYTYCRHLGHKDYAERSLKLLAALPAEDNRYIKQWAQYNITPKTALESQALLHLALKR
jgi:hypothetical protein